MPLVLQKEVAEKTKLGIWRIEESPEWFRSQLRLDERENEIIDSIRLPLRKLQWLSSRVLIRLLLENPDAFIHLESDERGKPVIHNFPVNISISHSAEYSALLLSEKRQVGIDLEKIDPKIDRIKHKFLSEPELKNISNDHPLRQLYIYWCTKEAMYKWHGKKQLDFREHMKVLPFEPAEKGILSGEIKKGSEHHHLTIFYEQLENYMVAYTFD